MGKQVWQRLVTLFYDEMERAPEARKIRAMHADDLTETREKLFEYFTGWFGGPALFINKYGHPRLRARHIHLAIDIEERDAWLACLINALEAMHLADDLRVDLLEKIVPMADHMRNVGSA